MVGVPNTAPITLTSAEIYSLAVNAGFSTQPNPHNIIAAGAPDAVVATALALFESRSTNPTSNTLNPNGEYSIGPWQINIGSSNAIYNGLNAQQLTDPFNNASAAMKKFTDAGNSFSPWSTWPNGAPGHANIATFAQWLAIAASEAAFVSATNSVSSHLQDVANKIGSGVVPSPSSGGGSSNSGSSGGNSGSGSNSTGSGSSSSPQQGTTTAGILVVFAAILFLLIGAIIWSRMFSVQGPKQTIQIGPTGTTKVKRVM